MYCRKINYNLIIVLVNSSNTSFRRSIKWTLGTNHAPFLGVIILIFYIKKLSHFTLTIPHIRLFSKHFTPKLYFSILFADFTHYTFLGIGQHSLSYQLNLLHRWRCVRFVYISYKTTPEYHYAYLYFYYH